MNAAIDAGNTRIKVGLFDNEQLLETYAFDSLPFQNFYTFFSDKQFDNCIISSVIDIPAHIINYLKMKSGHLFELDVHNRLPLTSKYKTPETLGKDRLALAVAGAGRYPGKDVLIISAGTCITYNFVTAKSSFMGGAISPGLTMRLQAMHLQTSALPLVSVDKDPSLIENNTADSMLSGVVNGIKFEIEGFVNELRKTHKNCFVILSGGDSRYLASKLAIETDVEPDLALFGLNLILKFNAPEKN